MKNIFKSFLDNFSTPNNSSPDSRIGFLSWQCNICGALNCSLAEAMDRERGACITCASTMRDRCISAVLTSRLFGKVVLLPNVPENTSLIGSGMSDAECYAAVLKTKFRYTNTYYHCEPFLDITHPQERWLGIHDFIISSDVFEHVPPPVQIAFDNLSALLKPGGSVVFSVPFSLDPNTVEHFPNLHEYKIHKRDSEWVLENVTKEGKIEVFRNLVFHGGPGSTLEMRLFSLEALKNHLTRAGFTDIRVHNESYFHHGIFWMLPWSLIISAIKVQ